NGAHAQVRTAVDKALKNGAKGIVFDLRGNPGGILQEGQLVASIFVNKGLIVSTRGRTQPEQKLYATGDAIPASVPMVVLVDSGTASAAEITAGALRDYNRATVVGEKTFGKGVFQEVLELSNGGALDITAGQYFTPKGRNLGGKGVATGKGIAPDVVAKDDPKTARDEALDRAVSVVGSRCRP
ncbi:MAG: carboxyl-terminal processing protease, partial [Solirubrobacteraceae bacterium]|nr:carboxyl-terminal processing protease [Solirubrobacteraceae bacterium]